MRQAEGESVEELVSAYGLGGCVMVEDPELPFPESVAASDAFFPFPDGPQAALEAGVSAIIQPGGSIRDADVTAADPQSPTAMGHS